MADNTAEATTRTAEDTLIGAIVRDVTVDDDTVRYAIGRTGFLCLRTGTFLPYDSAFPGPAWFNKPEFSVEEPALH